MNEPWHGRHAVRLDNGLIEAVFLPGGGHIAEFRFTPNSGLPPQNAVWRPMWRTADPYSDEYDMLVPQYGDIDTGRFLASYSGHALCLDGFGPPNPAEALHGVALHGEAAVVPWEFTTEDRTRTAHAIAKLPTAGLQVERRFNLLPGESVLRVDEQVSNLCDSPRALHWVQHATFGPPFLSPSVSTVNASVTRGMSWPNGYEGHALLPDNAQFMWPKMQTARGDSIDFRDPFSTPGRGFVAAVQQDPSRIFSFVTALNTTLGVAIGYCYRSDIFPWLTIWEENLARTNSPWNGRAQVRGMEFGTTPFPLGRDEIEKRGALFGQETARLIGPKGELHAPWLMFLAAVPSTWRSIGDVRIGRNTITLVTGNDSVRISALDVSRFLEG